MGKTVIFTYQKEKLGIFGKSIKRPVAEVYFKTKTGDWIKTMPYIDSGADTTLIPLSTGELLGLTYKDHEVMRIGGLSGTIKAVKKRVKAKLGDLEFDLNLTWALTERVPALLGRKDVFDIFKITFNQKHDQIIFEET